MLTVSKLNLNPQWIYRLDPPRGQYFIDFKLDSKSECDLVEEARKLSSQNELSNFEEGIQEAATIAVLKIPEKEISSGEINEYMRLQIDPKYTGRTFAFQVKRIGEKNELAITKAEVLPVPEEPLNEATHRDLELTDQYIRTNINTRPIQISYNLDEKSLSHVANLISSITNEDEISRLEQEIRRAVRIAAHKLVETGFIYKPGGTQLKWTFRDTNNNKEFKFLLTIINGKRLVMNKIRIKDLSSNEH